MNTGKLIDAWHPAQAGGVEMVKARMGSCGLGEHFHDTWSVGTITRGQCQFNSGAGQHSVSTNELFVIPPYEVHVCAAASEDVDYVVLYIDNDKLEHLLPRLHQVSLTNTKRVWHAPQLSRRLVEEDSASLSSNFLDDLLVQLNDVVTNDEFVTCRQERHPLQQTLNDGWREKPDLASLERTTRYSRWYAIRTFQQQIGVTPGAYLRQLRVLKARHMLYAGTPLAEIADTLHFSDQAHFSRVFKTVFGVPPGRLQRVMQNRKK